MTPVAAATPKAVLERNAPKRMRNSPTNPLVPGSPMEDKVTIMKITAKTGMTLDNPPKSEIIRVCLLSYIMPTSKKREPVLTP